jgi:hypothetical protein
LCRHTGSVTHRFLLAKLLLWVEQEISETGKPLMASQVFAACLPFSPCQFYCKHLANL